MPRDDALPPASGGRPKAAKVYLRTGELAFAQIANRTGYASLTFLRVTDLRLAVGDR
jgi:hypothetical protein